LAREGIGLGLATERFGGRFFSNDARPSGVLKHPGMLGEEAQANIKDSWKDEFGGVDGSWKLAILEEGMEYQSIGMPNEDAQFLQTRTFQVNEIARWYGIPPHKLAEMEHSTYSNVEHMGIEYVQDALQPLATNFEQSVDAQLMTQRESERHFTRVVLDGLLRGDSASRHASYSSGLNHGYYSINDVRSLENLNPIDEGDNYRVPLFTAPVDSEAAEGAGSPPVKQQRSMPAEQRAERSMNARRVAREDFMLPYTDAAARILRREANDVGNQAKKLLGKRNAGGMGEWLSDFYAGHEAFVAGQMRPLARSYARPVARAAGDEVGQVIEPDRLVGFVDAYLDTHAARHSAIQAARIRAILEAHAGDEERALQGIEAELDHWRNGERAEAIAGEEVARFDSAVAVMVYVAAGVVAKRWVNLGESCPYCRALNGRVVGVEMPFLSANEAFQPDGADHALINSHGVGHPPVHQGCDCFIVAA
jgi:hypothetical protein